MARATEESIINRMATEFVTIDGIKNAYGFADNPDGLTNSQLPAVILYPASFESDLKAHHNRHRNQFDFVAILYVAPRADRGGSLKFLENAALPFLGKVRSHFQTEAVIKRMFNTGNMTNVTTFTGSYGAGGQLLTYNGVEYIGCIFRWTFVEIT